MILSYDVQNNLDVHSMSGMCQITHRKCFVLWQSFHFQGACICCHSSVFVFFLITRLYIWFQKCVYVFIFGCFVMTGGVKMKKKSFCPSFLVAEGMNTDQKKKEILNLWFWWVSVPKWKEPMKFIVFIYSEKIAVVSFRTYLALKRPAVFSLFFFFFVLFRFNHFTQYAECVLFQLIQVLLGGGADLDTFTMNVRKKGITSSHGWIWLLSTTSSSTFPSSLTFDMCSGTNEN